MTVNYQSSDSSGPENGGDYGKQTATATILGLGLTFGSYLPPGRKLELQSGHRNDETLIGQAKSIESAESPSPATLLEGIRESFHFNVTELAALFAVSRPTIYKWLKGESDLKKVVFEKMQLLSSVAPHWLEISDGSDLSFLLDYKGPLANEPALREEMRRDKISAEILRELMDERLRQYRIAAAESREMLGEAPPLPGKDIPEGTRRLHEMWHAQGEGFSPPNESGL